MRMFFLEIRRIIKAKQVIILLGIGGLLALVMSYAPISYETINYIDDNGNKVSVEGMDAIQYKKTIRAPYDGELTPQKVQSALKQYQDTLNEEGVVSEDDLSLSVYTEMISPIQNVVRKLPEIYADSKTGMGKELIDIPVDEVENYYEQCARHLDDTMKLEYKDNIKAQKLAKTMYERVNKPFQLYGGFSMDAVEYIGFYILLLLIICTAIAAPAFSEEYQNGSDSIFRCTRNGRLRLAFIKILSLFAVFAIYVSVCLCLQLVILNFSFGTECLKTSVQVIFSMISLAPYNLGELQIVLVVCGILSILSTISCTLFVSSKCKTTLASILISILICLAPTFICSATANSWVAYLFPSSGIGLRNNMVYQLLDLSILKIGKLNIWSPVLTIVVAIVELIVFSVLTVKSYCEHQVV